MTTTPAAGPFALDPARTALPHRLLPSRAHVLDTATLRALVRETG
ncbi:MULTISPECIES: hypothetical protein [unclassified Kitasatospora]|nr:hypothetical protein [Kitasatospora sp. MY 5-36]